jgi:hypothetical protein
LQALRALRQYRGDEAPKWAAIRARAHDDDYAPVRELALALLATGRGDDAATREVLRDRAVADVDPGIRADALRWYAVCQTDGPAAEFLRHRAVADPGPRPRTAALQSLGPPGDPAAVAEESRVRRGGRGTGRVGACSGGGRVVAARQ